MGSVDLNGGQERQIRVLLDAQKLTSHNFTVLDVREALQRENIEAPGGRMITGPQELGLRTLGRVTSADQFSEIVVGTRGGNPVRIRDVAQVEDGAQELRTWSALYRKGNLGQDVVSVQILRQSGANTVRVADDVRRQIDQLRAQMPPGVQLLVVHDISDFIKASVHSLLEHLILGSILASVMVWLFIRNWRAVIDRGGRDSGLGDCNLHADARHGFFAEQHDSPGADTGRRYRDRRRHHRAGEHFSLHGGKRQ